MSVRDCRYDGSRKLNIKAAPTGAGDEREHKQELEERTAENIARACQLQEMLMAEGREGLIVAIQARDAAGKDSLIKKVFSGLNPAGLTVHAFKAPTGTELSHDYLWRIMQAVPPRGQIGVFNRSHYEDVLVTGEAPCTTSDEAITLGGGYALRVGSVAYIRGEGYMASGPIISIEREGLK